MVETASARIFLSHSTQDTGFCDALVTALRDAGADVWYDQQSLGPGVLLRREIMRQLSDRPIFIVVLSKAACASQWVKDECEWAYELWREEQDTRVLLPVLSGPLERADFAELLYLKSMRRVEGDNLRPLPQQDAIAEMLRLLGLTIPVAPASALRETVPRALSTEPPTDAVVLQTQDKAPNNQNAYERQLVQAEQALARDPTDVKVWNDKGSALCALGRYDEATAAYDRMLALDPKNVEAWGSKGDALNRMRRYAEALAIFERALTLAPLNANLWRGKGDALAGLERDAEALAAYDQALARNPDDVLATLGRDISQRRQDSYIKELAACEGALAFYPNNAQAWANKGNALRELGRDTEADAAYKQARTLGWKE